MIDFIIDNRFHFDNKIIKKLLFLNIYLELGSGFIFVINNMHYVEFNVEYCDDNMDKSLTNINDPHICKCLYQHKYVK